MAMKRPVVTDPPWAAPVWPESPPDPAAMRVNYGAYADELVIGFSSDRAYNTVVVPVTTPNDDYAGLLVDIESGAVVGIHVYPLLALAVRLHPTWKPLASPHPQKDTVAQVIADIRGLYGRYGVDDPENT